MVRKKHVTSHRKTYTNTFLLKGLKRWQSVGSAGKALEGVRKLVGVVEKSR